MVRVSNDNEDSDNYNEYMWIDSNWELIGNTRIDLSDYYNKTQVDTALSSKADKSVLGQLQYHSISNIDAPWNDVDAQTITFYRVSTVSQHSGTMPFGNSSFVLCTSHSSQNYGMQFAFSDNPECFASRSLSSGVWTAWKKMAGSATTLAGYGITNAYTKSEVDTKLNGKISKGDVLRSFAVNVGNITVPTGSSVITLTIPSAAKFDGLAYDILFFARGVPNVYFQWTPDNVVTYLNVQGTWKVSANNMSGSSKTVYLMAVIIWYE